MFFLKTMLTKNGPDDNILISFVCKKNVVWFRSNNLISEIPRPI